MADDPKIPDSWFSTDNESAEERRRRRASMPIRVGQLHDDHDLETARYYLSKPVEERIAAVEELRKMWYGEDYEDTGRLSRSTFANSNPQTLSISW